MVRDAAAHEAEDKERREAVDARNQLEALIFSVDRHLEQNREKVPEETRQELETALGEAKTTLEAQRDATDARELRSAHERLQRVSHKMAEALYKGAAGPEAQAGGGAQEGGPGRDDVVDAEYEAPPAEPPK